MIKRNENRVQSFILTVMKKCQNVLFVEPGISFPPLGLDGDQVFS
jgi:hypothetical protein